MVTAHCSWTLFGAAAERGWSAAALFTDIKGAYYAVIRQYVVGTVLPEDVLRVLLHKLDLAAEVVPEALAFINEQGSLLRQGNADPALITILRGLNEES